MNNRRSKMWEDLKTTIRFWLAGFAIKHCGIEVIFWSAPQRWEEYMKTGEPFTPDELAAAEGVVKLMQSSKNETEWKDNAERVKSANDGYPRFWYPAIVASGVMASTIGKWKANKIVDENENRPRN